MKKRILSLAMALAMLAVLVMPMAALAVETSTSTVSGTMGTYYRLTVPPAVNLGGSLNNLANNPSGVQTISVAHNAGLAVSNSVQIAVIDSTTTVGDKGFLKRDGTGTGSANVLSTALILSGAGTPVILTKTLSGTSQTLLTTVATLTGAPEATWSNATLVITQPAFTSVTAGTFSTIITFTATFSLV